MIITNNSVFLHIPKTGGMWVRNVMADIALTPFNPKDTDHTVIIPAVHSHKKTFTFVRNPWAWYVSFYNYLKNGSRETWLDQTPGEFFKYYGDSYQFQEFVTNLLEPGNPLKNKVIAARRLKHILARKKPDDSVYLDIWGKSNISPYKCILDTYTKNVDFIGKTEDIRTDLKTILESTGDLTIALASKIDTTPVINKGIDVDYRSFYNTELKNLIANDAAEYIDKFQYVF